MHNKSCAVWFLVSITQGCQSDSHAPSFCPVDRIYILVNLHSTPCSYSSIYIHMYGIFCKMITFHRQKNKKKYVEGEKEIPRKAELIC